MTNPNATPTSPTSSVDAGAPHRTNHQPVDDGPWTGVLFVHGMGSQRRFGDVSALVEALDLRSRSRHPKGQPVADEYLFKIQVGLDDSKKEDVPPFVYLDSKWHPRGNPPGEWPHFRFYEAYWAPLTAEGVPTVEVIGWLFAQVLKPIASLAAPWRGRARLRRSILQGMKVEPTSEGSDEDQPPPKPGTLTTALRASLLQTYDAYEEQGARAAHPTFRFAGFRQFIDDRLAEGKIDEGEASNLTKAAKRWRRACVWAEIQNFIILATLACTLLSTAGLLLLTAASILGVFDDATLNQRNPAALVRYIGGHWGTFATLGSAVLVVSGVGGMLSHYLGDVVFWTTYEETQTRYEKRRQILKEVRSYLSHLIESERCTRIVVVAHSLGTAIALDAILAEARDARALEHTKRCARIKALRKITHVVTYGSPIDKIHYFFERDPDQHRYHRMVEDLRGDIGTEPFANKAGEPLIHWINFWDPIDVISGTLESPINRRYPDLRVDNVEVNDVLPNPLRAHTGYLRRNQVVDVLLDTLVKRSDEHRTKGIEYLGRAKPNVRARVELGLALTVAWMLVGLSAYSLATVNLELAQGLTYVLAGLAVIPIAIPFAKKFALGVESFVASFGL